jgi:hypothetical protein
VDATAGGTPYPGETVVLTAGDLGAGPQRLFEPEPLSRLGTILQSALDRPAATAVGGPVSPGADRRQGVTSR